MDWDAQAKRVADYIHQHMSAVNRGAVSFGPADCAVLFGNDGYAQGEGKGARLVQELRSKIPTSYAQAGFNTSEAGSGSTWALIVRSHMGVAEVPTLHRLVWDTYGALFPGNESKVATQREIAYPHIKPLA